MRSTRCMRALALVSATAGIAAGPAQAKFDNSTYPPLGSLKPAVHHKSSSSDEWLIAGAVAGGVVLAGAGVATSRRATRRTRVVRATAGS